MKKLLIIISVILLFLIILFVPYFKGTLMDGGTTVYKSLTYTIVKWHKITDFSEDGAVYYTNTSVYWFPDNSISGDMLWHMEMKRQGK